MTDEQKTATEGAIPAPSGKVITFSLPESEAPPPVKRKLPRKKRETLTETDFSVYNAEDYQDLSSAPRRRAREVSLLLLFAAVNNGDWSSAGNILADTGLKGQNAEFALEMAQLAYAEIQENDVLLAQYAREWDVERFSSVDRNILRLALSELKHEDGQQTNIILNEAIELGKKFGSAESGAFVNGMLDNIFNQELKDK